MPDTPEPAIGAHDDEAAVESRDRRRTQRREGERRHVERATRQSALALLFGILGFGIAALLAWRQLAVERELARERGASALAARDLELIRAQLRDMERRSSTNALALQRLAPLPDAVDAVRAQLEGIEARLAAPQRAVARTEAAHLVEFAIHRLELEHDVAGAAQLFEAAAARLEHANDPALAAARAQILRDLGTLGSTAGTDVRAIADRLARLEDAADALPVLGAIQGQYVPPHAVPTPAPGLARAWQQFTTSLRDLVAVRRVSDATIQLVSLEDAGVRRRHLETLLFAARLAALRGDAAEYSAALHAAGAWLQRYFDTRDARARDAAAELAALEQLPVAVPMPDVSASLRLLRGGAP